MRATACVKRSGPERCWKHRAGPNQGKQTRCSPWVTTSLHGSSKPWTPTKNARTATALPASSHWVRIKPFKPASKAFPSKPQAQAWATALEAELKKQRDQGKDIRKDLPALTIKGLVEEFLADPETQQLKYLADLQLLLGWWSNRCGGERVMAFGVVKLREARDLLRNGCPLCSGATRTRRGKSSAACS